MREELKELSPFLADRLGEEEGFKVPKNYFKALPDEVLGRLREEMKSAPVQSSWLDGMTVFFQNLWQPRLTWAVASAAVLIAAAVWLCTNDGAETPAGQQIAMDEALENIPDEDIHAYLFQNIEEVDNDLLISVTSIEKVEQKVKPLSKIAPEPDADEMEKYLEENIEDLDLEDLEEVL